MVSGVGVKVKDGGTAHQRPGKLIFLNLLKYQGTNIVKIPN